MSQVKFALYCAKRAFSTLTEESEIISAKDAIKVTEDWLLEPTSINAEKCKIIIKGFCGSLSYAAIACAVYPAFRYDAYDAAYAAKMLSVTESELLNDFLAETIIE